MLKPLGSFSLAVGSLSAVVGIGRDGTGASATAAGLSGAPCIHEGDVPGAGVGRPGTGAGDGLTAGAWVLCCAATGAAATSPAASAASSKVREGDAKIVMAILLHGVIDDALRPFCWA